MTACEKKVIKRRERMIFCMGEKNIIVSLNVLKILRALGNGGKLHQKLIIVTNKKNAPKTQGALCFFLGLTD
jgi:hypothetical protein